MLNCEVEHAATTSCAFGAWTFTMDLLDLTHVLFCKTMSPLSHCNYIIHQYTKEQLYPPLT